MGEDTTHMTGGMATIKTDTVMKVAINTIQETMTDQEITIDHISMTGIDTIVRSDIQCLNAA